MKKRIGLMVNCLKFGGAERVFADLSLFLTKCGYDVHLLLMDDRDIAYEYSGTVHRISFWIVKDSPLSFILSFQHYILILYYKIKLRLNFTISALDFLNFLNLATPFGGKIIPTLHNHKLQCEITPSAKDNFIEWMFSKLVKRSHAIVTVSNGIKERAINLYKLKPERVVTIHNPISTDKISRYVSEPIPEHIREFMTDKTFVNISRLTEQKSLHKLILAFNLLRKKHNDARLVIIGDGLLRAELEALIKRYKLDNRVIITGFLTNPFNITAKARGFVLSSHYEGFGNVIIEAMCCKTCVISTDCMCGPGEIISPDSNAPTVGVNFSEFGILVPTHNGEWSMEIDRTVKCLFEAMDKLIEQPELYVRYKKMSALRAGDFAVEKLQPLWLDVIGHD